MSLLAVIPARLAASRLPDKPLRDLGGRPLVVRVWERVVGFGIADACVVATDSERVCDAVRRAGGCAVMTGADHASGTDRVAEVARSSEFSGYTGIVNVQGDEPFVSVEAVAAAAEIVVTGVAPIGTVAVPDVPEILASPAVVKVVVDDAGRALLFSRAPIPFLRDERAPADRAARDVLVRRHVGVYAYSREALLAWVALPVHPLERIEKLEQLRPLAHGMTIGVATVADAGDGGIDTPDDLERANARIAASRPARPHSAASPDLPVPPPARSEVVR